MGTQIITKSADFSALSIGFVPPVTQGLEFWNYFGDAAAKTPRNLVVGKPAAAVVGTPVVNTGYCTFTGNSHFVQTGLLDQAAVTLLAVARSPAPDGTNFGYAIGTYNAGTSGRGSNLEFDQTGRPTIIAARNNGSSDVGQAANVAVQNPVTNWSFLSGRMGATLHRIDDKTRGLTTSQTLLGPRSTPNGLAYRVGSGYATVAGQVGVVDIAFAAIYSRELTDAEVEAIYQRVKAYEASRGKTI